MRSLLSLLVLPTLLLSACGEATVVDAAPAGTPYDGPMHVRLDFRDRASVMAASGAAGRALECDGAPYRGGGAGYDDGLVEVQDSAEHALENWLDSEGAELPDSGYRVERADDGRTLLSWDVGDRTRVAVIVTDGVTDYNDDTGWGVEAWASCDPAELGDDVADAIGVEVWRDAEGRPVRTTKVVSFSGSEHCDWQDITWLRLGMSSEIDRHFDEYVRDTAGELADYQTTTYDGSAELPAGARDTGWHRDGRELWLDDHPEAAYLVDVDDASSVERWPASKRDISCA